MYIFAKLPVVLLAVGLSVTGARAQSDGARQQQFNLKDGLALNGYDPVSYFDGRPAEGTSQWKTTYRGVTYYFASSAHLEKFRAEPDRYEPAYGGWCAYAMGNTGEKVKVDPETFKIVDGKVYLFYNFWGNNTLSDWNKNEKNLKTAADANWRKFNH